MTAKACIFILTQLVFAFLAAGSARGQDKEIVSGACTDFALSDLPVGNFTVDWQMPETVMRITQGYNNTKEEGYCNVDGLQPPAADPSCEGEKIFYGHDGIDLHPEGTEAGQNPVLAVQDGYVLVSHKSKTVSGWGETIIFATRDNEFSDEILTFHQHHLNYEGEGGSYVTSRRFNACDKVSRGQELAREGKSDTFATHLHFSVRRWKNITDLKKAIGTNGWGLYGHGYTFGDDNLLKGFLDPAALLYNVFYDFQDENIDWAWALPFALEMRHQGFEFGLYNGKFGASQNVERREIARWLKIGAKRPDVIPAQATFPDDLALDDTDSPYVEALVRYPAPVPAINPGHSCQDGKKKFCPDNTVSRVDALKMTILSFYSDEFLKLYDSAIWKNGITAAVLLLSDFQDVDPFSWYAPYVFFGLQKGLVADQPLFHPEDPVTRAEMAKWIISSFLYGKNKQPSVCDSLICGSDYYCDLDQGDCVPIPKCIPTETRQCEVGGGNEQNGGGGADGGTAADGGSSSPPQDCPQGTTACQGDCCDNITQTCFEGTFCVCKNQYLDCGDGICRNSQSDQNNCGGCGNICDPGETCINGFCVPGGGCACSSGICCDGCHYKPDKFAADAASACYNNPQGAGTPTICLEVQQLGGPSFSYRVCKQGNAFQNQFSFQLKDYNNLVSFGTYTGSPNTTCTGWHDFSVGYIGGYGADFSAGLSAEIISPSGCNQSSCNYKTGTITITKTCD